MKQLIILGAGGLGREIASAAKNCRGYGTEFVLKGFLDDRADALATFAETPPVLGSIDGYAITADDVFISAIGDIPTRRKVVAKIAARGGCFQTLVDVRANVGERVQLGAGCYLAYGASLTCDITLGDHVMMFHHASIGHDTRVGSFSHLYAQVSLGGELVLGEGVAVYPGAVVVPRRKIGNGAVIGAGSVVLLNVHAGERVFGNPAQVLR